MSRSIGILGGTFDPIHNAHLDLAQTALRQFGLDKVLFIPAKQPPHKGKTAASYDHRVSMVELAIRDQPEFEVSRIEETINGPSYTIKTIELLKRTSLAGADIYLLVGLDTFNDIKSWYHYHQLLHIVNFIVVGRKGHDTIKLFALLKELGYRDLETYNWMNSQGNIVKFINHNPPGIASSDIRENLSSKGSIAGQLPSTVKGYIDRNALYGCNISE